MIELRRAVFYLGEPKLEVLVKDQDKGRLITISWSKSTDPPPDDWVKQVEVESGMQRDNEQRIASGRPIL